MAGCLFSVLLDRLILCEASVNLCVTFTLLQLLPTIKEASLGIPCGFSVPTGEIGLWHQKITQSYTKGPTELYGGNSNLKWVGLISCRLHIIKTAQQELKKIAKLIGKMLFNLDLCWKIKIIKVI